jgi:hypothetical protein
MPLRKPLTGIPVFLNVYVFKVSFTADYQNTFNKKLINFNETEIQVITLILKPRHVKNAGPHIYY